MLFNRFLALFPAILLLLPLPAFADETAAQRWLDHFAFKTPIATIDSVCTGQIGALPAFEVEPPRPGLQLVRVSLPFAPGAFPWRLGLSVRCEEKELNPDIRILTRHPGKPSTARRAILTFPFDFADTHARRFTLNLVPSSEELTHSLESTSTGVWKAALADASVSISADAIGISFANGQAWNARLIAPPLQPDATLQPEVIEWGAAYCWVRLLAADAHWPRIIELRMDALGTVAVQAHLQRLDAGDATAPDLGWEIKGPPLPSSDAHAFSDEKDFSVVTSDGAYRVDFPIAPHYKRGRVSVADSTLTYLRCTADEKVALQESAWRRAEFVIAKANTPPLNALLEPAMNVRIPAEAFQSVYGISANPDLALWPSLRKLQEYTRAAIAQSMVTGDDFGNVTSFTVQRPAAAFGMNRLNHCPAIFAESWRGGGPLLRETALQWCGNMYDLSLWWADTPEFGGTRYNNATAGGSKEHADDTAFMWRMNNAVHFCTKGFDSFFYAYEETGDPRMSTALHAQRSYSAGFVHTDQGECRNIGDVRDQVDLYKATGLPSYREEALRLFGELRTKLSNGDLFSQGGQPIVDDPPFMDDDSIGYKSPFAKPYIIGYALAGLPELLRICPEEPKLRDVVRAVADFLASSQDPVGGWRYPHPRSSRTIVDQAMEHACQLARAAAVLSERGEDISNLLDAIERALQARVNGFLKAGTLFSGLQGWEQNPGMLKDGQTLYDLYKKPADRDTARDYTEGSIALGGACPEGLVYFSEVLSFFLAHRPAERLFNANETLQKVLARMGSQTAAPQDATVAPPEPLQYGVQAELPAFRDAQVSRMTFPLSWTRAGLPFDAWRKSARDAFFRCLPPRPPLAPLAPVVVATEDRGSYEARKVALSLSEDTRVTAYLLMPKGKGPFPGIVALHDHGAHFSIGKEKVVRPFGVSSERLEDAEGWVEKCYGGAYIGDELAARGYVVFATDALFWGDRGRSEGVSYQAQQALAANLIQLGYTWAGLILWDDIRSAEFLQGLPEVQPDRIGCIGLSMGSFRTWELAAATDIIKAGAAICWMGDTPSLTSPGNNQTTGQSAFSMLHPGLRNVLDYPDVASIACPKPMLFFNGEQDTLFPVSGVQACYDKLHRVWKDRGVEDRLLTKLWPVPHEFNREMQAEAFAWLDRQLKRQ